MSTEAFSRRTHKLMREIPMHLLPNLCDQLKREGHRWLRLELMTFQDGEKAPRVSRIVLRSSLGDVRYFTVTAGGPGGYKWFYTISDPDPRIPGWARGDSPLTPQMFEGVQPRTPGGWVISRIVDGKRADVTAEEMVRDYLNWRNETASERRHRANTPHWSLAPGAQIEVRQANVIHAVAEANEGDILRIGSWPSYDYAIVRQGLRSSLSPLTEIGHAHWIEEDTLPKEASIDPCYGVHQELVVKNILVWNIDTSN